MSAPQPRQAPDYYSVVRSEIIPLIAEYRNLVTLDVGCAAGQTSALLRELSIAQTTLGIEYSPEASARASAHIDDLKTGDVESLDLSDWQGKADLVLCLDVLEHLRDPWSAVKKLTGCLKPGGRIVASIPNVQNKSVVFPLLRGQWNYGEAGLLDRTHLRFFTHRTAHALLESNGLTIEKEVFTMGPRAKVLNALSFGALRGFLVSQYVIRARI